MPRSRYRFVGDDAPYFMTMTINHWLPVFTRPETVEIVLDSWRWLREHEAFRLHGYVVLENHLHLIGFAPDLGKVMQRFKSYTARQIIDCLSEAKASRLLNLLALFKRDYSVLSARLHESAPPARYRGSPVLGYPEAPRCYRHTPQP